MGLHTHGAGKCFVGLQPDSQELPEMLDYTPDPDISRPSDVTIMPCQFQKAGSAASTTHQQVVFRPMRETHEVETSRSFWNLQAVQAQSN